jgi:peptide deformylase
MTILKILQYPDPRLFIKAKLVDDVHRPEVQQLIDDMLATLANLKNCAGLAATQLDVKIPWSVTVIASMPETQKILCLINPEILHSENESKETEGCMSVCPDKVHARVKRATKITFRALDRNGNKIEMSTGGFLAKCVQHEVDHLNGIIYINHLTPLKRKMLESKIIKLSRLS